MDTQGATVEPLWFGGCYWTSRGIDGEIGWAIGPNDGGYWADLVLDARLEQTVAIIPGATYGLGFFSGLPRAFGGTARLKISAGTRSVMYDLPHEPGVEEWVPGSMVFPAEGSTTMIALKSVGRFPGLDDVRLTLKSLSTVPEPAEYATAFGAGTMACRVLGSRFLGGVEVGAGAADAAGMTRGNATCRRVDDRRGRPTSSAGLALNEGWVGGDPCRLGRYCTGLGAFLGWGVPRTGRPTARTLATTDTNSAWR